MALLPTCGTKSALTASINHVAQTVVDLIRNWHSDKNTNPTTIQLAILERVRSTGDSNGVSASALGRLGETAFGNPSRDFTLRKAGYSYPSRWVEEPGYWLYEGVFGGPSSDKDRRNTTLEGAEGERDFGKKVERGAGWEKTLVVAKPKSRGNPYFLHIGGEEKGKKNSAGGEMPVTAGAVTVKYVADFIKHREFEFNRRITSGELARIDTGPYDEGKQIYCGAWCPFI
ncbi:hypothetical protein DFH06DRAFT_1135735 [Mycena polygramma]|nr:hypothetical protein DFH06DRAFT_1135735 [Mycena polygramma]